MEECGVMWRSSGSVFVAKWSKGRVNLAMWKGSGRVALHYVGMWNVVEGCMWKSRSGKVDSGGFVGMWKSRRKSGFVEGGKVEDWYLKVESGRK